MPRRIKYREEKLNLRREDRRGDAIGILDPTPYIAVLNMLTNGKYLEVGGGFPIKQKISDIRRCPSE